MKSIALFLSLLVSYQVQAQDFVSQLAKAESDINYSTIEFLSAAEGVPLTVSGDPELFLEDAPRAESLRVVVYLSEIYHSVVIETVITGTEGCCSRVLKRRTFDLDVFASHFGFRGERSGFTFTRWSSPRSFTFTYQGSTFTATVLQDDTIRVART